MQSRPVISDDAVLDYLFNPVLDGAPQARPKPAAPQDITGVRVAPPLPDALLSQVCELEAKGIVLAEEGKVEAALDALTQAVELSERKHASSLNNRAQALRLLRRQEEALEDLSAAIALGGGGGRGAAGGVGEGGSEGQPQGEEVSRGGGEEAEGKDDAATVSASEDNRAARRVLTQALTQRGMLYRLMGKDDAALKDLRDAGRLGSVWARQQAAALNPYAAMCNQVLSEALKSAALGLGEAGAKGGSSGGASECAAAVAAPPSENQ